MHELSIIAFRGLLHRRIGDPGALICRMGTRLARTLVDVSCDSRSRGWGDLTVSTTDRVWDRDSWCLFEGGLTIRSAEISFAITWLCMGYWCVRVACPLFRAVNVWSFDSVEGFCGSHRSGGGAL